MRILPDSSVLIPYFARQRYSARIDRALRTRRMAICSVVAAEVRAGARNQSERRIYDHFFAVCGYTGLTVTPDESIWHSCGRLLSRCRERKGEISVRDHQNDILILLTARRLALEEETVLLTENEKHFHMWLDMAGDSPRLRIEAMRQ